MPVSLAQQIDEIEREIAMRKSVYPRQVASRALRQSVAEFQLARIEAVHKTLLWLRDNEAEIRQIMAARRAARGDRVTAEVISHAESFEVRYSDGRDSRFFYHDDNAGRRAISGREDPETARAKAEALAGELNQAEDR